MTRYRYRKYRPGDEEAINELYFLVTGRRRTTEQFRWQWLNAPAGEGESWLIEFINSDGSAKLIGHHGIMPLFFSYGQKDILAGKTENTMVLPEYRQKILYPKFENIFLQQYQRRFDLLFSTLGPPAALRQRLMQGYEAKRKWLHFEWVLCPGAGCTKVAVFLAARKNQKMCLLTLPFVRALAQAANKCFPSRRLQERGMTFQVLGSNEAKQHPFFVDFWSIAKKAYPLTPRREREDLTWRFWDNPYGEHITFVLEEESGGRGYAIVREVSRQFYRLEDIVIYPIKENLLDGLLNLVCMWIRKKGGNILSFNTVDDENQLTLIFKSYQKSNLKEKFPFSLIQKNETLMPRKCIISDLISDNDMENWYVTPFLFEGRL